MADRQQYPETDPRHHTANIRYMLETTIRHVREDIGKIQDSPRAEALFETTAEVLNGLKTAYEHFERGTETGWR
jgi:hypothetical protein